MKNSFVVFALVAACTGCDIPERSPRASAGGATAARATSRARAAARGTGRSLANAVVTVLAERAIEEALDNSANAFERAADSSGTADGADAFPASALPEWSVEVPAYGPSAAQVQGWLIGIELPVSLSDGTVSSWIVEPGEIVEFAAEPHTRGPSGALEQRVQFTAVADGIGVRVWGTLRYGSYTDGRVSDWYMIEFDADYVQPLGDWFAYLPATPAEEPGPGWGEW